MTGFGPASHLQVVTTSPAAAADPAADVLLPGVQACGACLARSWLLAALAPHLDIVWKQRVALRDVLALDDVALVEGLGGARKAELHERREAFDPAAGLRACVRAGVEPVCRHSAVFPAALQSGPGGPRILHVAGGLQRFTALVGAPAVAIVGTRRASVEGLEVARGLGRALSREGVTVVSGMALGIDSAAHAGALEGGAATVAVLAGAAERAYPRSKTTLHQDIVRRACAISELPPGFEPFRWCFPARNRIIAGLAELTVVVEGAERSGSLITADFASALGRDVGAVPGRAGSSRTRGSNGLLKDGALVVLDAADILDAVLGHDRVPAGETHVPPGLDPALAVLLDAVAAGRDTVAALADSPAAAEAAMLGLADLEGRGLVRRGGGGRWVVCS